MHFGLNDYVYNLIIDFFKSRPSIKIVRIYGSRVRGTNRYSSDIDLFIEGTFLNFMIPIIKKEINNLRHPYRIDLVNVFDEENLYFLKYNYNSSIIFYERRNFYPHEEIYESKFHC